MGICSRVSAPKRKAELGASMADVHGFKAKPQPSGHSRAVHAVPSPAQPPASNPTEQLPEREPSSPGSKAQVLTLWVGSAPGPGESVGSA